jgi:hypothetical protein
MAKDDRTATARPLPWDLMNVPAHTLGEAEGWWLSARDDGLYEIQKFDEHPAARFASDEEARQRPSVRRGGQHSAYRSLAATSQVLVSGSPDLESQSARRESGLGCLFEKTTWPLAVAGAARAASQGPRIDVGARMRGMWR